MDRLTIISREGILEYIGDRLLGLQTNNQFVILNEILESHRGKYIKLEVIICE